MSKNDLRMLEVVPRSICVGVVFSYFVNTDFSNALDYLLIKLQF